MYRKGLISREFLTKRHKATFGLIDQLNPNSIVDIGCDDGYFLKLLSERLPDAKLYACDMNGETLACTKKNCPKATCYEGDFLKLDLPKVDIISMLEILEHQKSPELFLEKANSLLQQGGKLLVSIPRPTVFHWNVIWYFWSHTLGRRWLGEHTELNEEKLIRLAEENGFRLEKKRFFFFDCIAIMLFRKVKDNGVSE